MAAQAGFCGQGRGGGLERILNARHIEALVACVKAVEAGLQGLEQGQPLDLVAETLRGATGALDGISGRSTPETLLDRIFAQFCLGK